MSLTSSPSSNAASPLMERQHYPALDGLRGLAILMILAYHNFGFIKAFFFGWLGVDLFFVLSGFLITDILLNTVEHKNYLVNFYTRRVLRIFPLYYLCLFIFLILLPRLNTPLQLEFYTSNQAWLWTYMQNWLFALKDSNEVTTLHHLWSLSIEEQFYIVWPLIILAIRKPKYLAVFISVLLLAAGILRWWVWDQQLTDISYFRLYTFTRIDGICVGSLVALLRYMDKDAINRYALRVILFLAGLHIVFFLLNRTMDAGLPYLAILGYLSFAIIFGLLLNWVIKAKHSFVNSVFTTPLLRFFGKISYGLYIFHWPVHLLTSYYLYPKISPSLQPFLSQLIVATISVVAAVAISWLSFRYYESYFLKLKKKFV